MREHVIHLTHHSRVRCAHRSIREEHVQLIVALGRRFHAAGAVFYFFGEREAQRYARLDRPAIEAIAGGVVVLSRDGQAVLTAYRNHKAPRRIRKKERWSRTADLGDIINER